MEGRRCALRTCNASGPGLHPAAVPTTGPTNATSNDRGDTKMAAKDRMAVLAAMMDQGVIPVFYHPDVEVCKKVIQACANGGAKCIEFTNRGDFAAQRVPRRHAAFRQGRSVGDHGRGLDRRCADRRHLHRQRREVRRRSDDSTPTSPRSATGARFPTARAAARRPRSATREELGCEIVKVFPGGSVGGPEFVKIDAGPVPVDADHAHRRRRARRGVADASGSRPASSACGIGVEPHHQGAARQGQDYAGIEAQRPRHASRSSRRSAGGERHDRQHPEDQARRRDAGGTASPSAR